MLKIERLLLKMGQQTILNEVCLELDAGSIFVLLGKSGSGKTSLLRCLAGLEQAKGRIACRGAVGFVPQQFALFPHRTLLENCAAPLIHLQSWDKSKARQAAWEGLSDLEIGALASRYPNEVSGGQQQRAAIVRALLLNPAFLLLDEPTSALDPESSRLLVRILRKLKAEGRGMLIVTQDMPFAQEIADEILFMESGCIVEKQKKPFLADSRIGQFLGNYEVLC